MGWYAEIIFLLLIRYMIAPTTGKFYRTNLPHELTDEGLEWNLDNVGEETSLDFINKYEDARLEHLARILSTILVQPWPKGIGPIFYVENDQSETQVATGNVGNEEAEVNLPYKRSRYYRKYPWKRQNSRYDAENRYLCQPTKDDVFRLLVALHEARQGNREQMINFCNRRRPATTIFTNIRFLG